MANASLYSNILENNFHTHLVIPELAEELGLDESIILQQIHYWITKSGKLINGEFWIYNTFEDWKKQFKYWSISKIKRIFYSLEGKGYIHSKKMNVKKSNHTKWYTVDYVKLVSLISKHIPEKKFAQAKNELSLCQSDTIINSKPYNNSTHINNLSNEISYKNPEPKRTVAKKVRTKTEISNFEKEICLSMIKIWNEVFIHQKDSLVITKSRSDKMLNLWDKYFHKNLEEWRAYCTSINSSKFLMGEKKSDFKARFDWLISEDIANRVLLKEFDIGDRVPDVESQALAIRVEEQRKLRVQQKAEFEVKKALEEEKRRVELLAEKLASEELQKQESTWSEEEKIEVRNAFEDYMVQEVIEDDILASFKGIFARDKWASHLISYCFEQFKIKFCLKKKYYEFVDEAQNQIHSNLAEVKSFVCC